MDIDKYRPKKKRSCLDIIKLRYKIHQRRFKIFKDDAVVINKYKICKKILNILFGIIIWGIVYFIGITSLHENYDFKATQEVVTFLFFGILYISWQSNKNYKNWLMRAEQEEFYEKFTVHYKPIEKFWAIIFLFIFAHYCNNFELILMFIIWISYDLYERRFLTNDIKQDLILKELKKRG